jgi:hypothetical protein
LITTFKNALRDESGTVVMMFAASAPVICGMVLLGASYSMQITTATQMRGALDAAVLAGTALPATATESERLSAAKRVYDGNFAENNLAKNGKNSFWVKGGDAPKFSANDFEVHGKVEAFVWNPMGGLFGDTWEPVAVKAAATKQDADPVCILGLNRTLPETIDMSGQPKIIADECAIQANSKSGEGIRQVGKPTMRGSKIGVTGNYTGSNYEPDPITGTAPIDDPFKDLAFPAKTCTHPELKLTNETDYELEPGVYCGGVYLNNSTIKLKPKNGICATACIYVFRDGPLDVRAGSVVTGDNVLLAFTGNSSTLYMGGSATMKVTSPTSGPYANMQFYGDPSTTGQPWGVGIVGNNTLEYDGVMYFPTQNIWFGGGSIVKANSPTYAMISDKIWFQDQSEITVTHDNPRNIESGNVQGYLKLGARLVE